MTLNVADVRSNAPEQIQNAVTALGKSKQRINVFKAIYRGKKQVKTLDELSHIALQDIKNQEYREIRILNIGDFFDSQGLVKKNKPKKGRRLTYEKIKFYSSNYTKIISLALNPEKQKKLVTKRTPKINEIKSKTIVYRNPINIKRITVDDLDTFELVRRVPFTKNKVQNILEKTIKNGFKNIVGEKGQFNDWGGEKNDLFTTKVKINGKRLSTAIGFKGRATKGILTPKKLGKNGDQINRLFNSSAQLFLIVYHSDIAESVLEQMQAFAIAVSYSGQKIFYGVIDGADLNRIILAYKKFLNKK